MPTDALDTYQELFKTASAELHLAEKRANVFARGASAAADAAGGGVKAVRNWINNTGPAQKINNSHAGKVLQSYGNDLFGITDPKRVDAQVDAAAKSIRDDAMEHFDKRLYQGMSDQEKQWAKAQAQKMDAPSAQQDKTYTQALEEHAEKVKGKAREYKGQVDDLTKQRDEAQDLADSRVSKWTAAGLGAGGLGVGAGAGYGYGNYKGQQRGKSQRNMAFGAGLAAGASGPQVIQGMSRQRAYRQPQRAAYGQGYGY